MKFRTYRDFCERTGKKIEEELTQEMQNTLHTHQFDAESGKPTESIDAELRKSAEPYGERAAMLQAAEKINAGRPCKEEQVKPSGWQIEDPEQTCYISIDDIGVKHQKEQRTFLSFTLTV